MTDVKRVLLSSVAKIIQGGRTKVSGNDFVDEGFPAYGAGGLNGLVASAEFDEPAVILSSIGARCGKCFFADGKWTSLANTQLIFPDKERADPRFLWFQLNDEARWHRSGTAQPFIKPSDVKAHLIALPPLPEQRRIAAMLDKADALRAKRRLAISKLDQLLQSVFLEMFGDPVGNPKGWRSSSIGAECTVGSGSTPSRSVDQYFSGDIPWVKSTEVDWGTITDTSERISKEGQRAARLKMFAPGTVVVALYGQGKTRGKCAILGLPATMNQACAGVLPSESINGLFLFHYLKLSYLTLRGESRGGNQENLNLEILKSFRLPVPPIEMQIRFAELASVLARRQAEQSIADLQLDRLFAAAQSQAFSGGL